MNGKITVPEYNAKRISDWLENRGGVLSWGSASLSDPGRSWITPAKSESGEDTTKPHWSSENKPTLHVTNPDNILVEVAKELKRFHVATRMGSQGMSIKVTDGGSRRIKREVAKAKAKHGEAWYAFDYFDYENCVILIPESVCTLTEWEAKQAASEAASQAPTSGAKPSDNASGADRQATSEAEPSGA